MQKIKIDEDGHPYIEISEGYDMKLEWGELSEKDKEKARIELRETPENVEIGLRELRELIDADPTLFVPTIHTEYLLRFLRPRKFYAKNAYDLMKRYYKFKQKYPAYCTDLVPSSARAAFDNFYVNFQPKRDQHGQRVCIIKLVPGWDPDIVSMNTIFRANQITAETGMLEPAVQVNGFVVIMDLIGLTLKNCFAFTPSFARMLMEWLQECCALRCKAVHFVNNPYIFELVFSMFRPFFKKKFLKRLFFHGTDFDSLLQQIDASCLRPCYGGTLACDDVDGKLIVELLERSTEEWELQKSFGIVKDKHSLPIEIVPIANTKKLEPNYVLKKKKVQKEP